MDKITEEQKSKAIIVYAQTGNLTKAAHAVGLNRITLYRETKRSKTFRTELENAKAVYCDALEAILDERIEAAKDGKDKASAILLIFKLKAELPNKYRERIEHKVDTSVKIISGIPRPEKPDK